MPTFLLGRKAKFYFGAVQIDGTSNTVVAVLPAMTEAGNIKDLSVALEKDMEDITVRGDNGWKTNAGVLKGVTVDFNIKWLGNEALFTAVRDAFINDTLLPAVILDQSKFVVGAQGPAANWEVAKFDREENLANILMANVSLVPGSYPQWIETEAS